MTAIFFLLILALSYYITNRNFKQIHFLLHTFELADSGVPPEEPKELFRDEYDIILNNIVRVFLQNNQLKLELADRQLQQKTAEMTALQMQINPHFLFNTLQTLDMEATQLGGANNHMNKIIRDLSGILKYTLEDREKPVLLKDELRYLRLYTDIQHYRYTSKFILYQEIDEGIEEAVVFRLMLQPLIENSLYHGIKPMEERGFIKLIIHRHSSDLAIRVIDNGVGMSRQRLAEVRERITRQNSRNIGLTNVNRRLVLHFGPDSALKIRSSTGRGTTISFRIPYKF